MIDDTGSHHMPSTSIGVASMDSDGSINLRLRADNASGLLGEVNVTYKPEDPQYVSILDHLGGLTPGQVKLVKPWP
jgi:hypothetical protein